MKSFGLIAFLFLVIALVANTVVAQEAYSTQDFVTVDKIRVNDVEVSEFTPVLLERGEQAVVEVFFTGNPNSKCQSGDSNSCYDTRVEVELEGWEFGDVRDVEGPFEVEPGVSYKKTLSFVVPEDMPASDDLDLNVEIKDDDDVVLVRYPVRLQEKRHDLNVFDVILNPTNNVLAGQPLFATVRVENLGDNVESSVKVTVSIPELGLEASEFVDQLTTLQDENDNEDSAGDAATTNDLLLMIPANTAEGDYNVVVTLEYNRGHSLETKKYTMHVKAAVQTQAPTATDTTNNVVTTGAVVSVDSQAQKVNQGQGAVYRFSVANLGKSAVSYTLEVTGAQDWANVQVTPSTLVVQSDNTGDALVYVAPKDGVDGLKMLTVKVMSGNKVVSEKTLSLEVAKVPAKLAAKTVFTWIFAVLLAVLAVLVIVVLVKKASGSSGTEGQTYY